MTITLTDLHDLAVERPTVGEVRDQLTLVQSQLLHVQTDDRRQEHAVVEAANLVRRALNVLHTGGRS